MRKKAPAKDCGLDRSGQRGNNVTVIFRLLNAAMLRHWLKRQRRARGLSTDLKSVIAQYHQICPEYAHELKNLLYPAPVRGCGLDRSERKKAR